MSRRIRLHQQERLLLKQLKNRPEIREMAVERGFIESKSNRLSYENLLRLMIPEDAEPIERPESEMVLIDAPEMKDRVSDLAGQNVPEYRVVRRFAEQFANEHNVEVNIDV